MIEFTILRDYGHHTGYTSHLALLSGRELGQIARRTAAEILRAAFRREFGYMPRRVRVWSEFVLSAGPIEESEGMTNGER